MPRNLPRGNSYRDPEMNSQELFAHKKRQFKQDLLRQNIPVHPNMNDPKHYTTHFFNQPPMYSELQVIHNYSEVESNAREYGSHPQESMWESKGRESGQNVFYDNQSNSISPNKEDQPKMLENRNKQLSFSNINSKENLSGKKFKATSQIMNSNAKSRAKGANHESASRKLHSRGGKVKSSKARANGLPETGRALKKKGSRVGRKKLATNEPYGKPAPTKRRQKKTGPNHDDHPLNRSYKNQSHKVPNYVHNNKKKPPMASDPQKKMGIYITKSPLKDEEKHTGKFPGKLPRTSRSNF